MKAVENQDGKFFLPDYRGIKIMMQQKNQMFLGKHDQIISKIKLIISQFTKLNSDNLFAKKEDKINLVAVSVSFLK